MSIDEAPEPIPIIPDVPRALSPLVRRICADNPGVMTGPGTNTYLIGVDEIAVIDPGPADEADVEAAVQARLDAGDSARDAATTVAADLGVPKRQAYAVANRLA